MAPQNSPFAAASAGAEGEVKLSDEAKKDTEETAGRIKASNAQTLAALQSFIEKNPNLDHATTNAAIKNLEQVGAEVDLSLKRAMAESDGDDDELLEIIRKLASDEYRLYSKKKNPKTGKKRNLGTFSSREKAKEHEKDVHFFKTQK